MPDRPPRGWPQGHDKLARAAGFESWQAWAESFEAEKGGKICGGKNPGTKRPCRNWAGFRTGHAGRGRCWRHQGRKPAIPKNLAHAEAVAAADPELLSVRDQMTTARMVQARIIAELEEVDVFSVRSVAGDAHTRIDRAIKAKDPDALTVAMKDLDDALSRTASVVDLYGKLESSIDLIRRLMESEARILKIRHDMVSREQLVALIGRVSRSFRVALDRYVADERIRREVMLHFAESLSDVLGDPASLEGAA